MDPLTAEQRHRCMASIRSKNTKPEVLVRKFLFSRGFRYRLNYIYLQDRTIRTYKNEMVMAAEGTVEYNNKE